MDFGKLLLEALFVQIAFRTASAFLHIRPVRTYLEPRGPIHLKNMNLTETLGHALVVLYTRLRVLAGVDATVKLPGLVRTHSTCMGRLNAASLAFTNGVVGRYASLVIAYRQFIAELRLHLLRIRRISIEILRKFADSFL